jgi:DNA-binding HxlR family transcriptional regulator
VEDGNEFERDRQRAEVFDALGHPTRIAILKALSEGALGFSDLKKKTAIESSGHLQHHLNKLNGLIKTDEYGKYALSDQGKDALLTVQTVENTSSRTKDTERIHSSRFNTNMVLKSVALLLVALLIASSAIALFEYNQTAVLQNKIAHFNEINSKAWIQVSGTVSTPGFEIPPTQIQFTNTATGITYAAAVQNGTYSISLPNQQTYNVICTWGGLTFNSTGIAISGIQMGPTLNVNAGLGVTSITQDFSSNPK